MAYIKGQPFKPQFIDPATGAVMSGGSVEFYLTGGSTPTPYYTDSSGTSGGNSLTLDSGGKPPNDIYFDTGITYKLVVKDSAGSVVDTLDPYSVVPNGAVVADKSFTDIAALIASNGNSALNSVYIKGYVAGWAASVAGPKGGHFRHRTGGTNSSPSVGTAVAVSTVGSGTQAGYCWDADGIEWKISAQPLNVFMFDVRGDGATDDRTAIQVAADYLTNEGGGEIEFPDSSGDYLSAGHVTFGGRTTVKFTGSSYVKITANSDGGFLKVSPSSDVTYINPLVDGNSVAGQNGIGTSAGAKVTVLGGTIKNFPVAGDYTGGKCIASDGWAADLVVVGTKCIDSHSAINVKRDIVTDPSTDKCNISVSGLICNNVDMPCYIGMKNTSSNDGTLFSCTIDNFNFTNCGKLGGIFVFDRASTVSIGDGTISAESTYNSSTRIEAIFRGRGRKLSISSNIQINQDADAIIDIDPLTNYSPDTSAMADNNYELVATGTYAYAYKSDTTDSTHANRFLDNSFIEIKLKNDVTTSLVTAATRNGTAVLDISLDDKRVVGRASRINANVANMAAIAASTTEMFDAELDHPSETTTNISDAAHAINTTQKRAGKQVFNSTNNTLYISSGSATTSAWYVADGSASITPS